MVNCIHCSAIIDEAYNFCVNCEEQVKCTKCNSYLLKDKNKCLVCGTSIVISEPSSAPINTLKIKETQTRGTYSLEVDLALTNEGMEKAAPFFSSVSIPAPRSKNRTLHINPNQLSLPVGQVPSGSDEVNISEGGEIVNDDVISVVSSQQKINEDKNPNDFFDKDSKGYLILSTPNLKAGSKKEHVERFFILYVWAYNVIFENPVPNKEHVISATRLNSLYDKNFSTYFNAITKSNFVQSDGTFRLNASGNKLLKTILEQMNNDSINGYDPSNSSSKSRTKGPRIDSETQNKINEWVLQASRFSSFDIRKADSRVKLCIIPFYDLIHELKVQNSFTSSIAYEYLHKKFKTINIDKAAFAKVVSGRGNHKYFEKSSDGQYYLTAEADRVAESMLSN